MTTHRHITRVLPMLLVLLLLMGPARARAWHADGHRTATTLAIQLAGTNLPSLFRENRGLTVHCSSDPDLFREYRNSQLRDQEGPEHYFDLELLDGAPIPLTRSAFVALCARLGKKPSDIGFLPYAVTEWTQRLAIALVGHRRWPENPHIRHKIAVYAGLLSHYAADLCMPLHTTVHYNGRIGADGAPQRTGIHGKVDNLPGKLPVRAKDMLKGLTPCAEADVMDAVLTELARSHRLVDRVYELEDRLPDMDAPFPSDPELTAFTRERLQAATSFIASLFLTAWDDSARLELPPWDQPSATGAP